MNEFYGGANKVPFLEMDCTNVIGHKRKKYLESNDTQTLLQKMLSPTAYHRRVMYFRHRFSRSWGSYS
jgi:hypothetical protein